MLTEEQVPCFVLFISIKFPYFFSLTLKFVNVKFAIFRVIFSRKCGTNLENFNF